MELDLAVSNVQSILDQVGFPKEVNFKELGNGSHFVERATHYVVEQHKVGTPIDLDVLLTLVCEINASMGGVVAQATVDILVEGLSRLVSLCFIKGKTVCKLFDALRTGVVSQNVRDRPQQWLLIPVKYHHQILSNVLKNVQRSNPPHIIMPGDKESYLQVSSVPLLSSRAYTMTMWLKLASNSTMKGFLLFRCRSTNTSIDAIVSSNPQDGEQGAWTLTLRSSCEKKQHRDEVQCKLNIPVGEWHLITVQQCAMKEGADRIVVTVDGASVLEAELLYPLNTPTSESTWIFGLGMKGMISSIALYHEDLHPTLVQTLHSFGPHVPHLSAGTRCPQSSFDTGHLILGSLCAKGAIAAKLCQYVPTFCVTAVKAGPDARTPLVTPGQLFPDHIDLQARVAEHDELLSCTLTGNCAVQIHSGGVDVWMEAGGCALVMYLFWAYSDLKAGNGNGTGANKVPVNVSDEALELASQGMRDTLTLLAQLIQSSPDLKEQFVQIHGFHVLGHCLSMLPDHLKRQLINPALIDLCFNVVSALGPDALKGDGITAAMQGLLFDFRIWGSCELPALKHFLHNLTTQLLETGPLMYKSIGIQRILDIFRLHIARKLPAGLGATAIAPDSLEECAIECADCVHRLLIICMEAAATFAVRAKTNLVPEAEALLKCLEETNSVIIAERILRIIGNMRITAPLSLKQALTLVRFQDTAIIPLLTKKGFSTEVRSSALCNLLWVMGEDVKSLAVQIIPLRKSLNQAIAALNPGGPTAHRKSISMAESTRTKALIEQINDMMKPLERAWVNILMITDVIEHTIAEGQWGKVPTSLLSMLSTSSASIAGSDLLDYVVPASIPSTVAVSGTDITTLIRVVTHTGQFESWMLLPLLPVLLSRSDVHTCCNVLMSINVMFKTDDAQSEVLSCIPTTSWLKIFVSIAIISEKAGLNTLHSAEPAGADSERSVAQTCVDLALDCTSIVLEYKTRTQLQETKSVWSTLQTVLHTACYTNFGEGATADEYESSFLRRIVASVLHRIANNPETWVPNLIARVVHLFGMVESRKLFSSDQDHSAFKPDPSMDLLNLDYDEHLFQEGTEAEGQAALARLKNKATQESNIICFVFDISASLRRSAERGALQGMEWKALKIALRITLQALDHASERVADRIMQEILAQLKYMSERWAPITGNGYKSLLMVMLTTLKESINNPNTPEYLRGRYSALVFGIMHSFIEIRHHVSNGGTISEQVVPALDALMGIDSCNDIALIFKLLDVTMRKADAISFEEVEVQQDEESPRTESSLPPSDSYIALNKERFTPDDDKLVKISDMEPSDYGDLPGTEEAEPQSEPLISLTDEGLPIPAITVDAPSHRKLSSAEDRQSPKLVEAPSAAAVARSRPGVSQFALANDAVMKEAHFKQWLKVRQGISGERVDSERARLARSMDTLDLTSEATKKFWKKARRKVESESFLQAHSCQWKLGVAHEGPFYGRRRIVLRPRFDSNYGHVIDYSKVYDSDFTTAAPTSPDQLNRALAKACAGYIKDVTRSEASAADDKDAGHGKPAGKAESAPGSGWGLVDVDGSEDGGFGVVGLAVAETSPPVAPEDQAADAALLDTSTVGDSSPAPAADDMQGDVRQLEENFKQGKGTETGPCHSGTRRVGSGPALLDTRVIMITASGNFWGSLSFNGKEIFFASSFEAEDGHKDDNAAVNLVKQRRMRRRRWVVSVIIFQ